MKYLVTGADGFVGTYLTRELLENPDREILGLGVRPSDKQLTFPYKFCDLRDFDSLSATLGSFSPDIVFHLAGQAFVPRAIENPQETLMINVGGTLNLLEYFRLSGKPVQIVYISSSEVYGNLKSENLPVSENHPVGPVNPYATSKVAAEEYCLQYARSSKNIRALVARPFNHIGVGQNPNFVVPNFCRQVLESISKKSGSKPAEIQVGDLTPTRDFLHVKDVVRAYILLSEFGKSGEIYNISSGKETPISQILQWIIEAAKTEVLAKQDPERMRPMEMIRSLGDNSKLKALGWEPKVPVKDAVIEIFENIQKSESIPK
ncbi:NAD-dependent epimerase/dehydratase family protein [Leptospira wolffii]|uniref:GDP-mannose 4,6-dehydratase n=1 Tax=Leptospira wolffii TaxID=409998 RepID=UPI0010843A4E|nr:GDP-mannose 4,6-dehydratase [Leptospira wolffii]TGK62035.1 NAD-dependent epimerase/dehydratase family protein [Leptospira wolffii]TGK68636.1 NAD-dependent epimerase/dehydratase family protein [Leptospira wolffii]TGK74580.1 NAD-dependent epimerase/dehydratase family protein [Leptospira wolffii]TGL31844.1 NAD-dependent epimerase/dehydratase family protein [Leptospira wolffii]